jgi:CDP-diacylglycerol--serine O-phosphatidyltransferase
MNKINPFSLPNIISYSALFLSLTSILFLFQSKYYNSVGFALMAFAADVLDGFFARNFASESSFGRYLDGYIDTFIYLIYPVLLFYFYFDLRDIFSIIIIYTFFLTGIFRLARFNVLGFVKNEHCNGYLGLPVFFSFLTLALVYFISLFFQKPVFEIFALSLISLQSLLMVTSFVVPKPKKIWLLITFLAVLSAYMFYLGFKNQ